MHIEGKIHPIFAPLMMGLANLSENMKISMNEQVVTIYVDKDIIKVITISPTGLQSHIAIRQEAPIQENDSEEEKDDEDPLMDFSGPGEGENVN